MDIEDTRQARSDRFLFLYTVVGSSAGIIFGTINLYIFNNPLLGKIEFCVGVLAIVNVIFAMRTKKYHLSKNVMLLLMIFMLSSLLVFGGIAHTGFLWFATFPILVGGLKKYNEYLWWNFSLLALIMAIGIFGNLRLLPVAYTSVELIQLIASLTAIIFLKSINKKLTEADEDYLNQVNSELAMLNQVLEKEQQKEGELQSELIKFKFAVENAYDVITITDENGILIYANPAIERMTGFRPEEAIGLKAGALWGGLMSKDFYKQLWHQIKNERKEYIGEFTNHKRNGETYVAKVTISPITGNNDHIAYYVGIERDITHEKEAENAKNEFLSFAAHQLRTPLTTIKWYTQMLTDGTVGHLTDQQSALVDKINRTNQRMNELIHEFLNISRLETGRLSIVPTELNLSELLLQITEEVQPLLKEKSHQLKLEVENHSCKIKVDEGLFRQIILNYLTNSIKYTPEKGVITIKSEQCAQESLRVSVSDTGIGIATKDKQNLFTKFFRAENARNTHASGIGLGLYFIKRIVDVVGGQVGFTSEVGKGSTFFILVPKTGWKGHEGVVNIEGEES